MHPRARWSDPETSHAAAASIRNTVGEQHARILYALQYGGAGTCYDIAARFVDRAMDGVAVARRMPELERMGKVKTDGSTRVGPNGRACRVWEVAE